MSHFNRARKLKEAFNQGKIADKPKPPRYRKSGGLALVSYPKQALRLVDGAIRIPLGKQIKCWFGVDSFVIRMPSNLIFADIKELRILPRNQCCRLTLIPLALSSAAKASAIGFGLGK